VHHIIRYDDNRPAYVFNLRAHPYTEAYLADIIASLLHGCSTCTEKSHKTAHKSTHVLQTHTCFVIFFLVLQSSVAVYKRSLLVQNEKKQVSEQVKEAKTYQDLQETELEIRTKK
jgi:hypothetical protein